MTPISLFRYCLHDGVKMINNVSYESVRTKNSLLKRVNIKDKHYTKRAKLESLLDSRETELLPNLF